MIKQLFTASSTNYGELIANYLDPYGRLFDGRLYRDSCVSYGEVVIKDLRIIQDRRMEDMVIVDNSIVCFMN